MKNFLKIIYIILLVILIKLMVTFIINEIFIAKYQDGRYNEADAKKLLIMNISQPYIAHYNYGNVLYKNGEYDRAINEYEKALKAFPPEKKECSIRINLALAMLAKIDGNQEKEEIVKQLQEARQTLCEDGCANKNDDKGHSKKAETLKKDIDNAIKNLQNNNGKPDNNNQNNEEEENNEETNSNQNKSIEEQLREIEKEGRQTRNSEMEYTRQLMEYEYSYDKKNW